MSGYSIAISGINAAQRALDIIGNNIANAATDGYHRQRVDLIPLYSAQTSSGILGGGVEVAGVTRMIDSLLEREILRQQSLLEYVSQEFGTMRTVENALGELSAEGSGLNAAIDSFFNALRDLSNHPGETIWQSQAVESARTMAGQFRTLGEFLTTLESQVTLEAENLVEQANMLINAIAKLNDDIERIELSGASANNLRDKRDQCITELSGFIDVQTQSRDYGVVDVTAGGIPVAIGTVATELEVGFDESGTLGITISGAHSYSTNVQGGRIGGLLSLRNELICDIHNELDSLASAIIQQINQYHVQGVGSEGSFTTLTGWVVANGDLTDFDPPITSGSIYIRVTDTDTGAITRQEIDISTISPPTLSNVAAYITSNVTGVNASVQSSKLVIEQSEAKYKFDFLPAVLPTPTASTLTGSPPTISVSGIYDGTENQTFEFTVVGDGSVGNGSLQLEVKNGDGEVVATLNVGDGYAAGDELDIGNGIKISLSTGNLNNGETFEVDAFGNTDTSGLLAATGINTFFSGTSASEIAVCSDIVAASGRIATSLGPDMTDNANALRLADLEDQAISSLSNMTPGEFYRRLVMDVGQQVFVKQISRDNIKAIVQNLANQQSNISGVNINDEAARLLVFEQMFQAMAKYMNTIQSTMSSLMEIL